MALEAPAEGPTAASQTSKLKIMEKNGPGVSAAPIQELIEATNSSSKFSLRIIKMCFQQI